MFNFFKKKRSAESAKERLQLVLVHDRTDLTPAQLEALKDELLKAISRYIDIDPEAVQIGLERDGRSQRLVADIPLRSVSRHRAG
jgi:cell division topological specificity factor